MRKMSRRGLRRVGSRLSRPDVLPVGAYRLSGRNEHLLSHPDGLLSELAQLVILPTYRGYIGFRFIDRRIRLCVIHSTNNYASVVVRSSRALVFVHFGVEVKDLYRLVECCLNWRVIVGLALVGAATFVVAPRFALAALPVLVVLVCPISMLFMMRSMGAMNARPNQLEVPSLQLEGGSGQIYSCPMHPEVEATSPGRCPRCGMNLKPRRQPAERARAGLTRAGQLALLEQQLQRLQSRQQAITHQLTKLEPRAQHGRES